MALSFTRAHFPQDVILMGVRWSIAYPLSTRHVEARMLERGVPVDHSTINRWVGPYRPQLADAFYSHQRPVWGSGRLDETYLKIAGQWDSLYRAVDKSGQTIDFLLTEPRATAAALRFLKKALRRHGLPETLTIDGSDAKEAAIKRYNEEEGTVLKICQIKSLTHIVEQDHRAVKRVTRPMLGFKSFHTTRHILVCIELIHMLRKGQMDDGVSQALTTAEQFYSLAA